MQQPTGTSLYPTPIQSGRILQHNVSEMERKKMSRVRPITAFWLVAIAFTMNASGQNESPVQISIRTETPTIKRGSEIKLQIVLSNVSDHPVDIYTASGTGGGEAEDDNGIYVRDASGSLTPRVDGRSVTRSDGKLIRMRSGPSSRRGVTLQPGEQFRDFTILSHLFDLGKPGVYTVTAKQDIRLDQASPQPTLATATSNTIQITVIDPSAAK